MHFCSEMGRTRRGASCRGPSRAHVRQRTLFLSLSLCRELAHAMVFGFRCKKCPKCGNGAYIPDKVACNHMSCACGAQWCWLCFKPWNSHSVCSPVPDRLINRDMSDKEKWMGTALGDELYQFLLDRYMYHDRCAMLVQKHLPRDIATFRSKIENFAGTALRCCDQATGNAAANWKVAS